MKHSYSLNTLSSRRESDAAALSQSLKAKSKRRKLSLSPLDAEQRNSIFSSSSMLFPPSATVLTFEAPSCFRKSCLMPLSDRTFLQQKKNPIYAKKLPSIHLFSEPKKVATPEKKMSPQEEKLVGILANLVDALKKEFSRFNDELDINRDKVLQGGLWCEKMLLARIDRFIEESRNTRDRFCRECLELRLWPDISYEQKIIQTSEKIFEDCKEDYKNHIKMIHEPQIITAREAMVETDLQNCSSASMPLSRTFS